MTNMKKQKQILTLIVLAGIIMSPSIFAAEVPGVLSTLNLQSTGFQATVANCNPLTVANGVVAAYPSCVITCNTNYVYSAGACVASTGTSGSSGGGGGGGGTSTPTTILGDFNNDSKVDFLDFNTLMINWGATGSNIADLNNDGVVDFFDFNTLMINWTK
jgi:hypothetical protein